MRRRIALEVQARSAAKPAAVFAILRDRARWPSFSALESFELELAGTGGEPGEVGEIGVFRQGRWQVREQIVALDPDRRLSYVLLEGVPIREYRADVELEADGDGTLVRWRASFVAAWPGTGWLFRRLIERGERQTTAGLARAAEAEAEDPRRELLAEVTAASPVGG